MMFEIKAAAEATSCFYSVVTRILTAALLLPSLLPPQSSLLKVLMLADSSPG